MFYHKKYIFIKTIAEGLGLILQSTIDLVNYLFNQREFRYVLNEKLNKDFNEII